MSGWKITKSPRCIVSRTIFLSMNGKALVRRNKLIFTKSMSDERRLADSYRSATLIAVYIMEALRIINTINLEP